MTPASRSGKRRLPHLRRLVARSTGVAGGLIAVLKYALIRNVDHAGQSYRGWLEMIRSSAVPLPRRVPTIVFFTVVAVFAFKGICPGDRPVSDWPMTGVVYCGIVALGIITLAWDLTHNVPGSYGLFMAVARVCGGPPSCSFRSSATGEGPTAADCPGDRRVPFYIGWLFGHVAFSHAKYAYGYLFFLLVAVEVSDRGRLQLREDIGRRKLRSEISPNKTLGWLDRAPLAVSLVLPWLLWSSFPHFERLNSSWRG